MQEIAQGLNPRVGNFMVKPALFINKKRNLVDYPWRYSWEGIKKRCGYPKYENFNRYGGRGIKNKISFDEVGELWFRDKAFEMDHPTIDRINNDGDYEISNCRFIERSLNASRVGGKHAKMGWSCEYACCIRCKKTDSHYARHGLCQRCNAFINSRNKKGIPIDFVRPKWSMKYSKCLECGTDKIRHRGHGLCVNCGTRKYNRDVNA